MPMQRRHGVSVCVFNVGEAHEPSIAQPFWRDCAGNRSEPISPSLWKLMPSAAQSNLQRLQHRTSGLLGDEG